MPIGTITQALGIVYIMGFHYWKQSSHTDGNINFIALVILANPGA